MKNPFEWYGLLEDPLVVTTRPWWRKRGEDNSVWRRKDGVQLRQSREGWVVVTLTEMVNLRFTAGRVLGAVLRTVDLTYPIDVPNLCAGQVWFFLAPRADRFLASIDHDDEKHRWANAPLWQPGCSVPSAALLVAGPWTPMLPTGSPGSSWQPRPCWSSRGGSLPSMRG